MSVKTYIADRDGKVLMPKHRYETTGTKYISMSNNVVEIDFAKNLPYDALKLESIEFGTNVKKVADDCFNGCTRLKTASLNDGLVDVGDRAFYNCQQLTSLNIPSTVSSIGISAFSKCQNISSDISLQNNVILSDYAFANSGARHIDVSIDRNSGQFLFANNTVKEVDVSNVLLENMFNKCVQLSSASLKNIDAIPASAFIDCRKLQKVDFPTQLTCIYNSAFQGCSELTGFNLQNTSIECLCAAVLQGCSKITDLSIAATLTNIEQIDLDFLYGNPTLSCITLLGMNDKYMTNKTNAAKFSTLGGGNVKLKYVSSGGTKYSLNSDGKGLKLPEKKKKAKTKKDNDWVWSPLD